MKRFITCATLSALMLGLPACDATEAPDALTRSEAAASSTPAAAETADMSDKTEKYEVTKSDAQWREQLTPEQYKILRKKGTERAFTGKLWDNKAEGTYVCAGCAQPLYSSETKFESGTGWPSFWAPVKEEAIDTAEDNSWFSRRTELLCSRCGGHLGHVFEDGPKPTGMRHCINSAALEFVPKEE